MAANPRNRATAALSRGAGRGFGSSRGRRDLRARIDKIAIARVRAPRVRPLTINRLIGFNTHINVPSEKTECARSCTPNARVPSDGSAQRSERQRPTAPPRFPSGLARPGRRSAARVTNCAAVGCGMALSPLAGWLASLVGFATDREREFNRSIDNGHRAGHRSIHRSIEDLSHRPTVWRAGWRTRPGWATPALPPLPPPRGPRASRNGQGNGRTPRRPRRPSHAAADRAGVGRRRLSRSVPRARARSSACHLTCRCANACGYRQAPSARAWSKIRFGHSQTWDLPLDE